MEYWLEKLSVSDESGGLSTSDSSSQGFVHVNRKLLLGRSPHSDMIVDERTVSWNHASVEIHDGEVWIRDLGSTNGTWIDGRRVRDERLLPGSVLMIGCSLTFAIRLLKSGDLPVVKGPDRRTVDLNTLDRRGTARQAARSRP